MPQILHISDLHVTEKGRTLEYVWQPVEAALGDRLVDFIVVSGDLALRAEPEEYDELLEFTEDKLLKRLHTRDPSRIVFIPGNHDVQWEKTQFNTVRFEEVGLELEKELQQARFAPEKSKLRIHTTKFGHLELLRIKKPKHDRRMTNVQAYLKNFYGTSLRGESRPFNLASEKDAWSCHAFLDENIAFVGLNSCHGNDMYWHGAGFDSAALGAAQTKVQKLRASNPNLIVIAVWHHGFSSHSSRPDRLSLLDLARIFNMKVHLGLHGHTHQADTKRQELINGWLPIIATGSLAAGHSEKPAGTPNQFCILTLSGMHVEVEVLRLKDDREYVADASRTFELLERPGECRQVTRCRVHRRICKVNMDGIARVNVEIDELDGTVIPVAVSTLPYCTMTADDYAKCDKDQIRVVPTPLPGGKTRYALTLSRKVSRLRWGYYVSNAIAMTQGELSMSPKRRPHYPHIEDTEDAHAHTVRFQCQRLELHLAMQRDTPAREQVRVLVEKRAEDDADAAWQSDLNESARLERRIELRTDADVRYWVLIVDGPIVGRRYSLVFKPFDAKRPYPRKAEGLAASALRECRGKQIERGLCAKCESERTSAGPEPTSETRTDKGGKAPGERPPPLREALSAALDDVFKAVLGEEIGEWSAHLWHSEDRALLPAFGRFRPQSWANYFEAGVGVAGHAFRHGRTVAWRQGQGEERTQTIFRKSPTRPGHRSATYKWVLCIPLRLATDGTSIGVIGLARPEATTKAEQLCESIVDTMVNDGETHSTLKALEAQAHVAFWTALGAAPQLTKDERDYAKTCVEPPATAPK